MKLGDTHPPLRAELFGLEEDQFYHSDIRVVVTNKSKGNVVVDSPIDERNIIDNEVVYYWSDDGSDIPSTGEYQVEFEITHPDGRIETFPPNDYLTFEVYQDL